MAQALTSLVVEHAPLAHKELRFAWPNSASVRTVRVSAVCAPDLMDGKVLARAAHGPLPTPCTSHAVHCADLVHRVWHRCCSSYATT